MGERAKILTVSDSVAAGERQDRSGAALAEVLAAGGWTVVEQRRVADGRDTVAAAIVEMAAGFDGVLVSTGGTGFAPRDLTPEATLDVIEREAPGLAEAARAVNPLGRLSRARAGILGTCIVLNTPGSPRGAVECLEAVLDVLGHALALLRGERPH